MKKCFVIQPFDEKFDKRFEDVFKPAINNADFEAYRIDNDLSVDILIDDIEKGISECAICFAEITTNNPNVWYELGFAFALNKDVVMVCSKEREDSKFPFDIRHRHILTYDTSSPSDFKDLEIKITKKIQAIQLKSNKILKFQNTPVVETEGLKGHEIALLLLLMENQVTPEDYSSISTLKQEMNKSGYTDIATSVGFRSLLKKGMLETSKVDDDFGSQYLVCKLTSNGENWILTNQDHIKFRQAEIIKDIEYDGSIF